MRPRLLASAGEARLVANSPLPLLLRQSLSFLPLPANISWFRFERFHFCPIQNCFFQSVWQELSMEYPPRSLQLQLYDHYCIELLHCWPIIKQENKELLSELAKSLSEWVFDNDWQWPNPAIFQPKFSKKLFWLILWSYNSRGVKGDENQD